MSDPAVTAPRTPPDSPVEFIHIDSPGARLEPGIALCLSGGGYRAMLFHTGALWRLNQLGYLPKLARVSSVSGGSITAGVLALNWKKLNFDQQPIASDGEFASIIVSPIRNLANRTIDVKSILSGLFLAGSIADKVAGKYRDYLFGEATLQDLPDQPRFVFNATNVQSGALWRFSKPFMADYRVGLVRNPTLELAVAVAASSAFPPVLSPLRLALRSSDYVPNSGMDLQKEPFTTSVVLTDGGVYDNLGLETAWKNYDTILVSDGGGKMQAEANPKRDWVQHMVRVLGVIDNQVRSLRKRQVIDSFKAGDRKGTYWGIRTNIADYKLATAIDCPFELTTRLANLPTRLECMDSITQSRVINWGYAVCDAAMRTHVDNTLPAPSALPYVGAGLG